MIRNDRLTGGLELVHYRLPQTRFVEISLAVGVGTRLEPPQLNGISHFLEHILFRGCRTMPTSFDLNRAFDRIGDGLNAYTHKEYTLFSTRVPVEELARALRLLAEVVSEPLFDDVKTEAGIILEEVLEELDEKGKEDDLDNISRKVIFGKHPLGKPVLGRPATLKNITAERLREFHAQYYVPSNMVLSIAGGVTWDECVKAANQAFGHRLRPQAAFQAPLMQTIGPEDLKPHVQFVKGRGSQVEVLMSFFMPGERVPGELARMFLARVLDDGISSRLQRTLCERRGLLYDISCAIESFTDVELFDVQFSVSVGKLAEVVGLVAGELNRLKTELIAKDEWETVSSRFKRDVQHTAESARGMSSLMAEVFLLKLPMPIDPREYQASVNEVNPESVRHEAMNAFRLDRCAFFARGKISKSQQAAVRKALRQLA